MTYLVDSAHDSCLTANLNNIYWIIVTLHMYHTHC